MYDGAIYDQKKGWEKKEKQRDNDNLPWVFFSLSLGKGGPPAHDGTRRPLLVLETGVLAARRV